MAEELGKWPIEPAIMFVVTYYASNADGTSPTGISLMMRDYNEAVEQAKTFIRNAANVGVCSIQIVSATMVFPFVAWGA